MQKQAVLLGAALAALAYSGVAVVALALSSAAHAASLDGMSGTLGAGYSFGLNHGVNDLYGVDGSLDMPIADLAGFEVQGGYHRPEGGGYDIWEIGGTVHAGNERGRLAANFMYHDAAGNNVETYGVGGEYFVAPEITVALRGGGVYRHSKNGGYVGGQGTWYATPNLAFSGTVDYWSAGVNQTSETLKVEWLPCETTPISVYTGYQHWNSPGLSDSAIFVGVRFYLSGSGAQTLVDHQRRDVSGFISQSPMYDAQY